MSTINNPNWKLLNPTNPAQKPNDFEKLLNALNSDAQHAHPLFDLSQPIFAGRAPGRLDLMGGIADYSGALVLELPLAVATYAAVQASSDRNIIVRSLSAAEINADSTVSLPLDAIKKASDSDAYGYSHAHELLTRHEKQSWAAYVIGTLIVLLRERGLKLNHGLRILIASQVPAGKGVSSSAAIEVASMQALVGLLGVELMGREAALLCQKAENLVVGAPCGVMDQMTSACGEQDSLLALLCQPAELQDPVKLPPQLAVWGIDSGVRHAVSGSDYTSVRVGAFMGYRIVADVAGLEVSEIRDSRLEISDTRFGGCLANITPSEWETHFREHVPHQISGAEFLQRYGGFTDTVTKIDPARVYAVRQPTEHPIYEHHRVQLYRALLSGYQGAYAQLLGELMFQSHQSYSACGLGSEATDQVVELVRQAGAESGLYGAKITGGGSGGTVAVLGRADAGQVVQHIAEDYARSTGRKSMILTGSSHGAMKTGILQLVASL
jgi:L-arabinokinase